jgi:hypothetical protein
MLSRGHRIGPADRPSTNEHSLQAPAGAASRPTTPQAWVEAQILDGNEGHDCHIHTSNSQDLAGKSEASSSGRASADGPVASEGFHATAPGQIEESASLPTLSNRSSQRKRISFSDQLESSNQGLGLPAQPEDNKQPSAAAEEPPQPRDGVITLDVPDLPTVEEEGHSDARKKRTKKPRRLTLGTLRSGFPSIYVLFCMCEDILAALRLQGCDPSVQVYKCTSVQKKT